MPELPSLQHLTEEQVFAYLDQALSPGEQRQFETHLAACQRCARKVTEHSVLFSAIEGLPDQTLQSDLAPVVLSALEEEAPRLSAWWWLVGLQGVLAVLLIAFTLPILLQQPFTVSLQQEVAQTLAGLAAGLDSWLASWEALLANLPQMLEFEFSFGLDFPMQTLLWLLLLVTLTWIVGNALLLRPHISTRKRPGNHA